MLQFTRINADTYVNKEFGFKILRALESSFYLKRGKTFIKGGNKRDKKFFFTILSAAKFAEELLALDGVKIPDSKPRFVGKGAKNFASDVQSDLTVNIAGLPETTKKVSMDNPLIIDERDMRAITQIILTLLDSGRVVPNWLCEAYNKDFIPVTGVADPAAYYFSPEGVFRYAAHQYTGYDWEVIKLGDVTLAEYVHAVHAKEFKFFIGSMTRECIMKTS